MPKKILAIDDDEMVLLALEELLYSKGYQTKTASGGKDALELLKTDSFDLVILDLIMPGMDGYEVVRRIRRIQGLEKLPIIMLTAMSGDEDQKKGLEAGVNLFLPKPISPQKLISLIEGLIV